MSRIDALRAQLADVPPKHRHFDRLFGPLVPTIDSSRYPDGLLTTERWGGQVTRWELDDTRKKVERSRDDATFGFYSRPTKAKVLETA